LNLPPPLHRWDLSPTEAVALQRGLAGRVDLTWDGRVVTRVAGVDVAFDRGEQRLFAGVVVLSYPGLDVPPYGAVGGAAGTAWEGRRRRRRRSSVTR